VKIDIRHNCPHLENYPQKIERLNMFYLAKNYYSTPTSIGFANTWYVVGFPTRAARDAHVLKCPNLATQAIKANDLRKFGGCPKKVNYFDKHGQYFVYMGNREFCKQ